MKNRKGRYFITKYFFHAFKPLSNSLIQALWIDMDLFTFVVKKGDLGTLLCDSTKKYAKTLHLFMSTYPLQSTYPIFTYCNLLEPGENGPFWYLFIK